MNNQDILNSIVADFSALNEVQSIVLGGSSAVKCDDNNSDFDIYIYCLKMPDLVLRRQIAIKYSENPEINNTYFELFVTFVITETGKPVDIMYRIFDDIERSIDNTWLYHNSSMGYTTCFVDNINKSEILYDKEGRFKKLQDKTNTPYPKRLSENIIKKNFAYLKDSMFSYFDQLDSAIKRDDFISVNHRTAAFLASYFDVIFAKNKILHPGEKRLVDFALKNCKILPENFAKDVNLLAAGCIEIKLKTAERMIENLRKILY